MEAGDLIKGKWYTCDVPDFNYNWLFKFDKFQIDEIFDDKIWASIWIDLDEKRVDMSGGYTARWGEIKEATEELLTEYNCLTLNPTIK